MAVEAVREWLADPAWAAPALALGVAAAMLLVARLRPGLPVSLLAVASPPRSSPGAGLDVRHASDRCRAGFPPPRSRRST